MVSANAFLALNFPSQLPPSATPPGQFCRNCRHAATPPRPKLPPSATPDHRKGVAIPAPPVARQVPSQDNWSLRPTHDPDAIKTSKQNVSEEVTLERAIVQRWPQDWTYQMPVASGLFGSRTDKRCAVDLVYDHKNGHYDFVELKLKSDNPLYAAMEILGYGLVYIASRRDRARNLQYDSKGLPVLEASEIALRVLAPQAYYGNCNLYWLVMAINDGLAAISTDELKMTFGFEQFSFPWKRESSRDDLPTQLTRELVCG